jgi:2-polyprenyl-6-methoxyphenol hydroxylase-like FAD-dependent oxidoreductase
MLGYLLARSGVDVVVLEKHGDFLRDFRGDTIHPSTLDILDQLGLADDFLALGPNLTRVLRGQTPLGSVALDFRRLPTRFRYVAFIPQWDFLEFLTEKGAQLPDFHLRMNSEAFDLILEEGQVRGVRVCEPGGELEVRAPLTVAADGRGSVLRERAGLPLVVTSPPVDVLWFRLSRRPEDPEATLGQVGSGGVMVLLNRGSYWQTAYTIPKGSFQVLRASGLEALREAVATRAPELGDRVGELTSWDQVKLLTVQADRLTRWYRAGLLCIGDAAHAMSPVGGIGINVALQDAVATANILTESILTSGATVHDLQRVQHYRESAVRNTQRVQVFAHRILSRALQSTGPVTPPLALRIITKIPGFQYLTGRFIGMGLQPQHIKKI